MNRLSTVFPFSILSHFEKDFPDHQVKLITTKPDLCFSFATELSGTYMTAQLMPSGNKWLITVPASGHSFVIVDAYGPFRELVEAAFNLTLCVNIVKAQAKKAGALSIFHNN